MKIELRKPTDVKPYPGNPRLNDSAVEAVARSLSEFGFRQPIVVDEDGGVIVGHTWLKPVEKLGLAEVPVHVAKSLTPVNPQSRIHLTASRAGHARAMNYSSRTGENVLDLFGGSGSTHIAAEQTGRRAFLMEIDPLYVDVIVERWQQFYRERSKRARSSPRI